MKTRIAVVLFFLSFALSVAIFAFLQHNMDIERLEESYKAPSAERCDLDAGQPVGSVFTNCSGDTVVRYRYQNTKRVPIDFVVDHKTKHAMVCTQVDHVIDDEVLDMLKQDVEELTRVNAATAGQEQRVQIGLTDMGVIFIGYPVWGPHELISSKKCLYFGHYVKFNVAASAFVVSGDIDDPRQDNRFYGYRDWRK